MVVISCQRPGTVNGATPTLEIRLSTFAALHNGGYRQVIRQDQGRIWCIAQEFLATVDDKFNGRKVRHNTVL
jgi:hypothetical protein